jgi:hypothetical protein
VTTPSDDDNSITLEIRPYGEHFAVWQVWDGGEYLIAAFRTPDEAQAALDGIPDPIGDPDMFRRQLAQAGTVAIDRGPPVSVKIGAPDVGERLAAVEAQYRERDRLEMSSRGGKKATKKGRGWTGCALPVLDVNPLLGGNDAVRALRTHWLEHPDPKRPPLPTTDEAICAWLRSIGRSLKGVS